MTSAPKSSAVSLRDAIILIALTLLVSLPGLASLTVIDRDEARYAQATVQMLETGDYIDIRFQQAPRWKKPAGAYWAQAASIKTLSAFGLTTPEARAMWAHRLPSVLSAIIAVLATFYGGAKLIGRDGAFIGAMLLAVSLAMMFEAHIAKTDALLTAGAAVCFAALCYLRSGAGRKSAFVFWVSMGLAVMVKGPIVPVIVLTCLASLAIWERRAAWMKPLRSSLGIIAFIAIVAPWTYLIYQQTGGDFFKVAVSEDLAPKLAGQSENHGGPVGFYLMTVWAMFWPGTAFLIAGVVFGIKAGFKKDGADASMTGAARLLICFALPWWIIVEIAPTKLPHYTLPIYPALALMGGAAAAMMISSGSHKFARRIGAVMFALIGVLLTGGLLYAQGFYGGAPTWEYGIGVIIIAVIITAAVLIWIMPQKLQSRRLGVYLVIASGAGLGMLSFGRILPSAEDLSVSRSVAEILTASEYELPLPASQTVLSPVFAEPSLVYYLGTHIQIGGDADVSRPPAIAPGAIVIVDKLHKKSAPIEVSIAKSTADKTACFETLGTVEGVNYSKGDEVILTVMRAKACP